MWLRKVCAGLTLTSSVFQPLAFHDAVTVPAPSLAQNMLMSLHY